MFLLRELYIFSTVFQLILKPSATFLVKEQGDEGLVAVITSSKLPCGIGFPRVLYPQEGSGDEIYVCKRNLVFNIFVSNILGIETDIAVPIMY